MQINKTQAHIYCTANSDLGIEKNEGEMNIAI